MSINRTKSRQAPQGMTVLASLLVLAGCKHDQVVFLNHHLNETYEQFAAIEHPSTQLQPGIPFTGTIHCFETPTSGDGCKGPRGEFDNAHFTFVNGLLASFETVGAGGIIGHPRQNWNWNLYLSQLQKQFGKPDTMTADDAAWKRGDSVIHAYLTVGAMGFHSHGDAQTEHLEVLQSSAFKPK